MSNLVFSRKLRSSTLPSITVLISSTQPGAELATCRIDNTRREGDEEEEEEGDKNKTDQRFNK